MIKIDFCLDVTTYLWIKLLLAYLKELVLIQAEATIKVNSKMNDTYQSILNNNQYFLINRVKGKTLFEIDKAILRSKNPDKIINKYTDAFFESLYDKNLNYDERQGYTNNFKNILNGYSDRLKDADELISSVWG